MFLWKKKSHKISLLVMSIFFFSSHWLYASARFVTPKIRKGKELVVPILKEKKKKSDSYRNMKKGEVLKSSGRKGMYWEVDFEGKKAYVSVKYVKPKKSKDDSFMSAITREVQKSRNENDPTTARARSTVMGVRGLADSGKMKFAGNVRPNLRLVYAMENILVTKNQLAEIAALVEKEVEMKQP